MVLKGGGSVHNLSAVAQGLDLGLIHYESEEQCHDILDRYLGTHSTGGSYQVGILSPMSTG